MPVVDFVIGGAQKSGTTALHSILSQNPAAFLSRTKELHFFTRDADFIDRPWDEAIAEYETHFAERGAAERVGEATPTYMWYRAATERIHRYNPAMKWIISLRDPKQRALSQWQMRIGLGTTDLSFEDSIAREIRLTIEDPARQRPGANYIAQGLYFGQILRLIRMFGRKNVLVVVHDRLVRDFEGTMARIDDFLFGGRRFSYTNEFVGGNAVKPTCRPDTLTLLNEIFRPDIERLEARLGLDLSAWKSV